MKRLLPLGLAVLVAGAAALTVNLLLVDYASSGNDPVGKLSPRAALTTGERPRTTSTQEAPTTATTTEPDETTTAPTTTEDDDDGDGSGRGRGRNRGRGGDGSSDDD